MSIAKFRTVLSVDRTERRRLFRQKWQRLFGNLRAILPNRVGPTYWTFRPDSDWVFESHTEFEALLSGWCAHNRMRNIGDLTRLYSLVLNLKQVVKNDVPGSFAEVGVYKGNSASILAHFAAKTGRRAYLFDTFGGFDESDLVGIDQGHSPKHFSDTSLASVKDVVGNANACRFVVGLFPESVTSEAKAETYSFVHLDCDLYRPIRDGLDFFGKRMSPGGMIFVHDYSSGHWPGATKAVDEFCAQTGHKPVLLPDKSGTAVFMM